MHHSHCEFLSSLKTGPSLKSMQPLLLPDSWWHHLCGPGRALSYWWLSFHVAMCSFTLQWFTECLLCTNTLPGAYVQKVSNFFHSLYLYWAKSKWQRYLLNNHIHEQLYLWQMLQTRHIHAIRVYNVTFILDSDSWTVSRT